VRPHDHVAATNLSAALPQIANEFLTTFKLRARRLIAIKVADQTNPKSDVVQIIAVHVAAVDLTSPAIAYFDLPVACRCSIANDEVVGKTILHMTNTSMVIIEDARVALTRATVMHHNHLPAGIAMIGRCAIDFRTHGASQIAVTSSATAFATATTEKSRPKTARSIVTGFLDGELRRFFGARVRSNC
jgi:hypothetical protein